MNSDYEIIINSKTENTSFNIVELLRYKDLIILLVKRNLALLYKQTVLGPAWLVLTPLLTSIMFSVIFGQFAGIASDGVPHFIFYIAGTTMWTLFSSAVNNTSITFLGNAHIFGKVYFPRLTVPISQAITSFINFALQFLVVLAFIGIYLLGGGTLPPLTLAVLLIPILAFQAAVLGMAFGLIITSFTVKYRDLAVAIGFFMQLWLYGSPVIYPMSSTGGWMRFIVLLNPVTPIVSNFRYAFLGIGEPLYYSWALSIAVTIAALIYGSALFNKTEKTFIDKV